jgi:hypothetical protein
MNVRRRRLGAASIVVGTVALLLGLTMSPAHALAPAKTGWWFQPITGPLALPLPVPVVPDGGLFVQQGASEPVAFGALRYIVPEGSSSSLTLTAAPGSVALAASMQACKTSTTWQGTPSGPGSWDKRPSFGNPCAPGIVSSDGAYVAFNLNSSFVSGGAVDVAIIPLVAATPFAVAFAKPDADSLKSQGGKALTTTTRPTTTTITAGATPSGGGTSGVVAAPVVRSSPSAPATVPAASSRPAVADNVLNVVGLGDPDRGARAAALGGASLIVVGWWWLSTQSVRLPRLLGGVGGAAVAGDLSAEKTVRMGGVGRFARSRVTNALKLR